MKSYKAKQKITITLDWDFPNLKRMGKGKEFTPELAVAALYWDLRLWIDAKNIKVTHKVLKVKK